jgi:hypothetical protein
VLLIALVLATTLLLAWAGPHHPLSFLKSEIATLTGVTPPVAPLAAPKPAKEQDHTASTKPTTTHITAPEQPPPTPSPKPVAVIAPAVTDTVSVAPVPEAIPVAPIAQPADVPADTNLAPGSPAPAVAVVPDSAFAARDIAEKALDPSILSGTGRAELLKIVGKRDDFLITPATWTFFFYDKGAAGHARIVTVNAGKVVKSGEDLVDFASPYSEQSVFPEDQIEKDSTDALQIAESLVPDATVTSSEFTLTQQKNSVPMWKVTLWSKTPGGEDRKLGDVTLLAENGTLISKNLKP